ncbi:hypothetical protein RHGRI_014779 [Rhododendron griersonianum]|uniref:BED-type domain-containing protein n=1 Tax=Rhododendron griersonianum TaxID=479676 RepID=A0AAV6KB85_9ERIC|nr:hypothetical protein RHGRI_014779 [Rhododendron griersonianum]
MSQSQNISSAASNAATDNSATLRRASNDIGWEYGILVDPTNLDKIQCKLCGKIMSSGISRLKKHIAQIKGSVSSCPNASKEDIAKCKAAVEEGSKKKKDKLQAAKEIREEVTIIEEDGDEKVELVGTRKRPHTLGPMDKYVSDINPGKKMMGQQTISATLLKARTEKVDSFLARWVYEAGIPFHAIDNNSFAQFCEAVGQFGVGYQPPSQYKLREPLLKAEVERTKKCLKKQEQEWASTGCSIMTDAWSDRKRRSIMNLCVNCKEGTTFLSSKETSDESHTGEYIFNYVDKCIEEDQTIQNDSSIMEAVVECVERFYPEDVDAQDYVINKELLMYKNKIHTKKRNRLDATRMSNLVYVQFNAKLINKKARKKEKDVLLASEATYAQGWIVEGGDDDEVEPGSGLTYELLATTMGVDEVFMPRRSGRNVGVREPRELHEEDFVSEDESVEENEEIDFESDGDQVLEGQRVH